MKVQARVEKELIRATDRKDKLKQYMTSETIITIDERIKVLTCVLSDLDKNLDE